MSIDKSTVSWPFLNTLPPLHSFLPEDALSKSPLPVAGIYLLWSVDGQLVYIGQSSHIARRIGQHRGVLDDHGSIRGTPAEPEKHFQSATWTPIADLSDRLRIESILILAALPTYNRAITIGIAPDRSLFDSTRYNFGRAVRRRAARARTTNARREKAKARLSSAPTFPRTKARLGPSNRGDGP